ncbi:MAG: ImmA/IrrE family metallo-endopeptidase [Lachnospiraceae bacterium]|nr:ImmA/IrrE family metallo-endopeptidase [Lachnospiraceae bacterium]
MVDKGHVFEKLVHLAVSKGIIVRFAPLKVSYARIKGNRIALNQNLGTIEDFNYNLAHELAHYFLHYDKGDIIESNKNKEYEEQADRAAKMLLEALLTE